MSFGSITLTKLFLDALRGQAIRSMFCNALLIYRFPERQYTIRH